MYYCYNWCTLSLSPPATGQGCGGCLPGQRVGRFRQPEETIPGLDQHKDGPALMPHANSAMLMLHVLVFITH